MVPVLVLTTSAPVEYMPYEVDILVVVIVPLFSMQVPSIVEINVVVLEFEVFVMQVA